MRQNAMLHSFDPFLLPTFFGKNRRSEPGRGLVMFQSAGCGARITSLRIVQESRRVDDFQISSFSDGKTFRHPIDAQDMVKIVDGIRRLIPGAGFFEAKVHILVWV